MVMLYIPYDIGRKCSLIVQCTELFDYIFKFTCQKLVVSRLPEAIWYKLDFLCYGTPGLKQILLMKIPLWETYVQGITGPIQA